LDISCIVLAGGRGLRLGHDKALETVGNRSLLERVVSRLWRLSSTVIVVTAQERSFPQLIDYPELRVVADTYHGKGPLAGIYAGLAASDSLCNLVVACDMPFLNQALLDYMVRVSLEGDVTIPRLGDAIEPLHAVYSRRCLGPVEYLLKQGRVQVRELLKLVKVRYVEAEEINRFDPEHLSFFNVNTMADLDRARQMAEEEGNDKC